MAKNKVSNYIEFGSAEHAQFLGLRKAAPDDIPEIDGWTLVDMTAYGPQARPEFLKEILRQKVTELKTKPVVPQSDDPGKKGYAPEIFNPFPGKPDKALPDVTVYQP
jgi:hypothetical protein